MSFLISLPFPSINSWAMVSVIIIVLGSVKAFLLSPANAIANGTVEEAHNGKSRLFNALIGILGDKGVLAVGALIACYLLYKIWLRFKNPPNQTKFLPPKGY